MSGLDDPFADRRNPDGSYFDDNGDFHPGPGPTPAPAPVLSTGLEVRDAKIISAVLDGEDHKTVAARHKISTAHARRITQKARQGAPAKPTPASPEVDRHHQRQADHLTAEAVERVLGPWTDSLPDRRTPVNAGDPIPRPDPPDLFGLFYSGLSNVLHGPPGIGKTWLSAEVIHCAAIAGRVLIIDGDDSEAEYSRRALILNKPELTTTESIRRIEGHDWTATEPEHRDQALDWLTDGFGPGMIVLDSGTALGSGDNLDQWTAFRRLYIPARPGLGSLLLLHPVKDPDQRHGTTGGSRAIKAWVRGAQIRIDEQDGTDDPAARHRHGNPPHRRRLGNW